VGQRGLPARRFARRWRALGAVSVAAALAPAPPAAAPQAAGPTPTPEAAPPPADELGRGTPQASIRGYLEATTLRNYRRAMNYLDLRRLAKADAATRGPALAHQLRVVLDNTIYD